MPAQITWSRPSIALIGPSTAAFAASYRAWSSGVVVCPTWSDSTYSVPTCMAPSIAAFLAASGSIASSPERPDWIFSHTRGTPKNCLGVHLAEGPEQEGRVGDEVDVAVAVVLRDVEAQDPLGDVGVGEVGDA